MDKPLPKTVILRHTPPPPQTTTPDQPPSPSACQHCATKDSPLWRRGERGEMLCNACGLYWKHHNRYRPLNDTDNQQSVGGAAGRRSGGGRSTKTAPKRTALMPIDTNLVIQNEPQPNSNRKKQQQHSLYTDLPKRPRLRPALAPKPAKSENTSTSSSAVRFIMHGHWMLFPGDHVVVKGAVAGGSSTTSAYYAILVDFSLDPENKRKQCLLKWLLPKPEYANIIYSDSSAVEPHMFTVGDEHQHWEPIECIMDVFYSPYQHGVVSTRSPVLEDLEAAHWLLSMS